MSKQIKAPSGYAPGHFTSLIRLHNWPPSWEPQYRQTREVELSERARITRERLQALGHTGTIVGLSPKAEAGQLERSSVGQWMD